MYSPVPVDSTLFKVKAKYIPAPDGGLRLASVQTFSAAKFRPRGWEDRGKKAAPERRRKGDYNLYGANPYNFDDLPDDADIADIFGEAEASRRATRRAKIAAMDYILCNPDLDVFATLTYGQSDGVDRMDYDACYKVLRSWLNNRVTRRGLKYVAVCERQKKGGIHFHVLCNGAALDLTRARSPYTGKPLTHGRKPLYNISDWTAGYTSAEYISGEDCRDRVAKYIFKYMSKESFSKIGGRYFLHGGKMVTPVYAYGDAPEEFFDGTECRHERTIEIADGLAWTEYSFV